MIERRVGPDARVVAQLARGWESCRRVGRIRCTRVVLLVARVAERTIQRIIPVDMAIGALTRGRGMRSRQREPCRRVIKLAVCPCNRVVAALACGREMRGDVVHRSGRRVVVVLVASHARGAREVVVVVDVTIGALTRRHGVRSSQREAGGVVIEGSIQPATSAVALIAGLREIRGNVVWVRGALKILEVATHARCARQVVVIVDVAIRTLPRWNRVRPRQNESGSGVVKLPIGPRYRVVTLLAGRGEAGMGHRRGCRVEVGLMTADASRAGDVVVVVDVAIRALTRRYRVCPSKREAGGVVIKSRIQP